MVSVDEKMERARSLFSERAEHAATPEERSANEALADLAESIQENVRLLEHLRVQLDEVRHGVGMHLEVAGPVPHTHRRSATRSGGR